MYCFHRLLYTSVAALFICITGLVSSGFADGKFVIKPIIETGFQRDDNFYKSENRTRTVDTWNIKPGVLLGYDTGKSLVSLDYFLNYYDYKDEGTLPSGQRSADTFDYTEHNANFNAYTRPSERLELGLGNLFLKTRDPASADAASNSVDRYKYNMNRFSPYVQYGFADKFGLELRYTNVMLDYTDDAPGEGEDAKENRGGLTLSYYFNTTTSFDLGYQKWAYDYNKTTVDYDSQQVMAGVNHQFDYFTARAEAGYHDRKFDRFVPTGDLNVFAWKLSLTGQNPPRDLALPRWDVGPTPKSSVYLAIGSNLNDIGTGDTYYKSTRMDARLTYLVLEKINLVLTGWYTNSDYEASTRQDDRWFVSGAATYLFQNRFTLGIEAGHEERDSNRTGFDFKNNFVMLKAGFSYDLASR